MALDLAGRLVFLASPGNMATERQDCRTVIREFNEERTEADRVVFVVRAWEDMPGGVGRPQDRINPKLDDCDFMILILGDRWGSPPALDGPYTSGTEEEFHRCLDLLSLPDAPMRDLLVLFKTLEPGQLRDPGPQLLKVMRFRDSLESSKALHYVTFDSNESLTTAISKKLTEWARPLDTRIPVKITLSSLGALVEPPAHASQEQLLIAARDHAANGLLMQAEAAFAHAIKDGDVAAVSEFALFMRRTGRLEKALGLNRQIIENPEILSATDQDSVAKKVMALANMGVIHRKQGSLSESIDVLREAVRTAQSSALPVYPELCYALDNYGLSLLPTDRPELARKQFKEAHAVRKEFGTDRDLAQSAVNMGRSALLLTDFERAVAYFTDALSMPSGELDDHLIANALCGLADARLRQGSPDGVRGLLDRALELNVRLGNSDGISIAYGLLGRLLIFEGKLDLAAEHADLCRKESEKTNSATGRATAAVLLATIELKRGNIREAQEYLVQATTYSRMTGNAELAKEINDKLSELGASLSAE